MIKLTDCDFCQNCYGAKNGHALCSAFPDGIPYEHMDKNLKKLKECNNGVGFKEKSK